MNDPEYNTLVSTLADKLAHAIALAEGYFVAGSLPNRINNPGDMKLGDRGHGTEHDKTIYLTADDGWAALGRECTAILTGASHVYFVSWNFLQVADKWTGSDNSGAWCRIVCDNLNVDPTTTLVEWVKGAANESVRPSDQ